MGTLKIALITGAARRIGAEIARVLHAEGINIAMHCHRSVDQARLLGDELNGVRPDSACVVTQDLDAIEGMPAMIETVSQRWGGLDILVNNASVFYPTPFETTSEAQWDQFLGVNLKAPFFLIQAAAPCLRQRRGSIINIVDLYAERPWPNHAAYCISKAGLVAATKSLAQALAPSVRVNGIAPGAILWPEPDSAPEQRSAILSRIPLEKKGHPIDIARAVLFLIDGAPYMTGQILTIDGGRSLYI